MGRAQTMKKWQVTLDTATQLPCGFTFYLDLNLARFLVTQQGVLPEMASS